MEPLDSVYLSSQTDIINVEGVECRASSPVTSCAGSDCSISAAKAVAAAATEAAVEERNDVMIRLMGHLIPVCTGTEEGSTSETDTSIVSSASTLKRRLHNLPASSEAVELADRVAVLNRRIRRERDLYLHLQGLSNRIEEKDEGDLSTIDSSKAINSKSNRHQGQTSNARARRRERLNSGSAISQHQMASDLQLCSPGLSSPEPLTLTEIREDFTEEMDQLSSPIRAQYSFENGLIMNRIRENIATAGISKFSITQESNTVDDKIGSCQKPLQFFDESYSDRKFHPAVASDGEKLTARVDGTPDGHVGISNCHFDDANYFKEGLAQYNLSSEAEDPRAQATTSSTASSIGADYPYVTRKRNPMKFGGYRPSSGLIFHNLSSDSESDAISARIVQKELRSQKFRTGNWTDFEIHDVEQQDVQAFGSSRNARLNADGITEVEPFSVLKIEALEGKPLSPVLSADSRHFFEEPNSNQWIETCSELQIPLETTGALNGRDHHLDGEIGNMVKQNTLVGGNADDFHNALFTERDSADSLTDEKEAHTSNNLTYDSSTEISPKLTHHARFSRKDHTDILPSVPSNKPAVSNSVGDRETSIFKEITYSREGPGSVNRLEHQPVPAFSKSWSKKMENPEDLVHQARNHEHGATGYVHIVSHDDLTGNNVHPKIPPLEIESQDCSQCHSLSSEGKVEDTARSSLDVNALIQALSDVSLKQNNSNNFGNRTMPKLKSPLGYGNRFSGSSGPRSSEYTPAVGGSRQSLTSLEVSEAHSLKITKEELTARRQVKPLLKSDQQSAKSSSRTDEAPEDVPLEDDLSRENRLIPVVAKIDKGNIVCSEHPLRIKSIARLVSPRKYPNSDFRGEIANQLTSRTDVSKSSAGSRKSFRSLKSVPLGTKVHAKKMDGLQPKTIGTGLSAPLSGRRVLEPLNLVPKIKPELLSGVNRKFKRREKIAKDLSEIIHSQCGASSERTVSANSSKNSTRKSPLCQTKRTPKCSTLHDTEVSRGRRTTSKPSTERDHELSRNSMKGQKNPTVSSGKSSATSGNALYLQSERLSLSSDDCEGKMTQSPSLRDEKLTENDSTYDSEGKLYDQRSRSSTAGSQKISEALVQDEQHIRLSNLTTNALVGSSRNCVHVNNLQDGREVLLPCGVARCKEDSLRKTELFNRLPNEIIGSLTRHASLDTKLARNAHTTEGTPNTIENLRINIQEHNDQWIKSLQSNDDLEIAGLRSTEDKPSSADSSEQYKKSECQNLLLNRTKIPLPIHDIRDLQQDNDSTDPSHSTNCLSRRTNPDMPDSNIKQKSECSSESDQHEIHRSLLITSGPSSHQNTHRSITESTDADSEESERGCDRGMTEQSAIELCNFKDEQTVNNDGQDIRLCNIGVISNTMEGTISQLDSPEVPVSVHPSDDVGTTETMPCTNLGHSDMNCVQKPEDIIADICEPGTQFVNDLEDHEHLRYESKFNDNGVRACQKMSSPNGTRSLKYQTVTQHTQDGMVSSSLSLRTSLSMSKLNLSVDSKRDVTATTGANSVKKSQDRFPFTMSESAGRKMSKFKVVADVNPDKLIQEKNPHAKSNDPVFAQIPILAKSGDREIPLTDTVDTEKRTDSPERSTIGQTTPFLEEFTGKITQDSPDNWHAQVPFDGLNYMSYGCGREEPRTSMPTVREMVKRLSAKLRYSRAKRSQDTEGINIEILYRNGKCRCESGEGSSSATSLYQSQLLNTRKKLLPNLLRRTNNGSRASTGRTIKPRRNHERISMSMQHSPRKGWDQNDLWIQEFDSDTEFDTRPVPTLASCQTPNDPKRKWISGSNSPANDRYSMFLARRKLPGITNEADRHGSNIDSVLKCCEGGDSRNVHHKMPEDVDGSFNEVPEMVLKSPRAPANSANDNRNEFQIDPTDGLKNETQIHVDGSNSGNNKMRHSRTGFDQSVEQESI